MLKIDQPRVCWMRGDGFRVEDQECKFILI